MIRSKMWLDTDISNQPQNTNRESYNINNYIKQGSITQEFSTLKQSTYNKNTIHILPLNEDEIALFSLDNTIGILHDNTYTIKYSSNFLGFTEDTIISSDFIINDKGERLITFSYNLGVKLLNIDTGFLEDLQNTSIEPTITANITQYGSLQVGTYIPFCRYVKKDKSYSNYFKSYNPIHIIDNKESGSIINKSISVNITNLDLSYKYIELGYLFIKDGIKEAYIIKQLDVKPNIYYNILEANNKIPISLDELINDNIIYKNIDNIKITKEFLYGYGVSFNKENDNIQTLTNSITLNWVSLPLILDNNYVKTFSHGEVYCFYIRYKFKWGKSKWYLLIGRNSNSGELDDISINNKTYKRFEIEDTCSVLNTFLTGHKGTFSYWENQNESYPIEGAYPTGNVRHFKFPTLNYLRNNVYDNSTYGSSTYSRLGIEVNNINLSNIKDNSNQSAYGYEIGYAKRTPYNSLNLGQSIIVLNDINNVIGDEDYDYTKGKFFSVGGNYRISRGSNNINFKSTNTFRVYPLESLVNKSNLPVNSFREEYKLLGNVTLTKTNSDNNPLHDTYAFSQNITHFNLGDTEKIETNIFKNKDIKSDFILNNTTKDDIDNMYLESYLNISANATENYSTDIINNNSPITASKKVINTPFVSGTEITKLVTLLSDNKNPYLDFFNQDIISINSQTNVFLEGDCYINLMHIALNSTYLGANKINVNNSSEDNEQGIFEGNVNIKSYICESVYNFSGIKDTQIKHYPRINTISLLYLITNKRDNDPNMFDVSINKDYNQYNDLQFSKIGYNEEDNNSHYYIVRSGNIYNNQIYNIREFNQDDIYLVPKNKGKVINIEEGQDFLYIHTEYSLFRTVGSNTALTSNEDSLIYLKVGDIFRTPLYELQHNKLGLLGTKHKYSCVLSEYGYSFIDADKQKMFLIGTNGIKVLSNDGLNNKFKELLSQYYDFNPFTGKSIFCEFDEFTERLFVVIGDTCILYSFAEQGWLCFTTYIPDFVFKTRTNFYSLKNNRIYKHNIANRLNYIYDEKITSIANVVLPTVNKEGEKLLIKGVMFKNSVFDSLTFKNSYQDTGKVELIEILSGESFKNISGNVRYFQGDYYFYHIRDFCHNTVFIDNFISIDVEMAGTENKELSEIKILT